MTSRSSFTDEEWALLARAPLRAAMMVVAAEKGGHLRETLAIAKAYNVATKDFGGGELFDELLKASPSAALKRPAKDRDLPEPMLREALAILARVGTTQEEADYRRFVLALAEAAAHAHKGLGTREREVLDAIAVTLYGVAD